MANYKCTYTTEIEADSPEAAKEYFEQLLERAYQSDVDTITVQEIP